MSVLLDIFSWVLLLAGGAIAITAGVGLNRFPDVFARMHAASMLDTLGAACILVGLILQATSIVIAIKLLLVLVFLAITTTTAGHALVKSALASGELPRDVKGEPLATVSVLEAMASTAKSSARAQPVGPSSERGSAETATRDSAPNTDEEVPPSTH